MRANGPSAAVMAARDLGALIGYNLALCGKPGLREPEPRPD